MFTEDSEDKNEEEADPEQWDRTGITLLQLSWKGLA